MGAPLLVLAVVVAAWALDARASSGEPLRNVEVAGRAVGGLDADTLADRVAVIADRYRETTVRVETPEGSFTAAADELGLVVDEAATVEAALAEGREGSVVLRPLAWARALVAPREAPVVVTVDRRAVADVVAQRDPTRRREPVEPSLTSVDGAIRVVEGKAGRGLDASDVADAVVEEATHGLPVVVHVEPETLPPRFQEADAAALAERARALTAAPLAVTAGVTSAEVPVDTLRSWVTSEGGEDALELALDPDRVLADLETLLPAAGTPAVDAGFRVVGNGVEVVPAQTGTGCCGEASVDIVLDSLVEPGARPVELPLRIVEPNRSTAEARELGIVEPVASFTTRHAAGQPRVTNIHRIADITRGVVIEPDTSFSVNGHVGRRTREKGFVADGVIYNGEFTQDVGGGISQYATTLFNAAFFAGLELAEYQSHSIYISRYPYGREATLSFPKPDLVIENDTPYGVLLWPTYTADSITVTLYSTKHIEAVQSGQRTSPAGRCTRVTTERTRTYLEDGRVEVDEVYARYRPREGVDC